MTKHLIRAAIALFTVMCVGASAQPDCTPAPPKEFEGHIEAAGPGDTLLGPRSSIAATYFEQNGCDWGGTDLNGTDAVVFDVTGMVGTGTVAADTGITAVDVVLSAYFLSEGCERVGGEEIGFGTQNFTDYAAEFPEGAKWMVVYKPDRSPARDIFVEVRYDGKDCEVVVEPKPKKPKKKKKK